MGAKKKKKKETIGVIHQLDLIKKSPNKMNSSMEIVRQGVGVQRDKTKYNRKKFKKQNLYKDVYDDGYHCVSKKRYRMIPIIFLVHSF